MPERFPGAPEGSYVCEEGWLVIDDQAWTEAEWRTELASEHRRRTNDARRETRVAYYRRYRAKRRAAA